MNTLIVQSYKATKPLWIQECQQSVMNWSQQNEYTYQFVGDEIFSFNPIWFEQKIPNRLPIRSDLARLIYTKEALLTYDRVVWFDIDCFLFAPEDLILTGDSYLFGHERWIQPHKNNNWKIYKNVCNAFFQFCRGNSFLDFYIETAQTIIKKTPCEHIAPQMIGPKLLSALHNITKFPTTTMVGSASPWLIRECAEKKAFLYNKIAMSIEYEPCAGLNLCASLEQDDDILLKAMDFLRANGAIHKRLQESS